MRLVKERLVELGTRIYIVLNTWNRLLFNVSHGFI